MSDISREAERLKNQRDYNRRLADHQATVIDKLNAHITGLSARIEELEALLELAKHAKNRSSESVKKRGTLIGMGPETERITKPEPPTPRSARGTCT